jgi:formylglycine-generating enzyme required for sulfatase activity
MKSRLLPLLSVAALALNAGCHTLKQTATPDHPAAFVSPFAAATGIRLVPIPAGTFMMGSPVTELGRNGNEGPQTRVALTKQVFLGCTEVTQLQWTSLMGSNPSTFAGDTPPVNNVSWNEATLFCKKLTEREQAAGRLPAGWEFTLPTEAQWEYACRAGTTGANAGELDAMAWYQANSDGSTHPVGTKQPNAWGLYDMNGNVWEWCLDWSGNFPGGNVTDPTGPVSGSRRVDRGGGWRYDAAHSRSAVRDDLPPDFRGANLGFRLALVQSVAK